MERLTERNGQGIGVCNKKCDRAYPMSRINCNDVYNAFEKLTAYEDLEKQGLLIKLPCKVGDTIYDICLNKIDSGNVNKFDIYIVCDSGTFELTDLNKDVFLTQEEAEKALEANNA